MKKVFKRLGIIVLSLALTVSGFAFSGKAKAEISVDAWKATAVKTPTEGSLLGAGYISVEFDNSMSGFTYEVLLDGNHIKWDKDQKNIIREEIGEEVTSECDVKTFSSGTTQKTEVYTTSVAKHEITVVATNGSETYTSNPRTIYVSKKGLAMGDNMGDRVKLKELNCSWYYNWGTKSFNNTIDEGVEHTPMMWGGAEDNINDIQNLNTTSNYILGFNEPDLPAQANLKFWDAVDVWNNYISPLKMRKVSPAPTAPGGDSGWLYDFMRGEYICLKDPSIPDVWGLYSSFGDDASKKFVAGVEDSVDAVSLHVYRNKLDINQLTDAVETLWNMYDQKKPIWITEIGFFGNKRYDTDMSYENESKRIEIQNYLSEAVETLDSIPYVERYCWFPYDVDSENAIDEYDGSGGTAMFEYATGLYTDLGKLYSRIGNPSGYNATDISSYPGFDWNSRVRMNIDYDKTADKVTVSWGDGTLDNVVNHGVILDGESVDIENGASIDTSSLENGKHIVKVIFYNNENNAVFEKAKSFEIYRSSSTTTEQTTEQSTTKADETKINSTKKNTLTKPSKVTLVKAQNVKKKSVKLIWNRITTATKYKVQMALNKKFTKKVKTKITSKNTYKFTKLKKKKAYFFRVAALNTMGVGPWSNVKKVKIKK